MAEIAGLWGLPPGANFPVALVAGLHLRLADAPPDDWARVTIFVNSGRMARALRAALSNGSARLLPRILLLTDLDEAAGFPDLPPALTGTALTLELAALITRLIDRDPTLAPRSAVFDLAQSLAALLDEMHGEGVGLDKIAALDVGPHAAHWQRNRAIVEAAFAHFGAQPDRLPGSEARRARMLDALVERWQSNPPSDPVIIAGSTGSRRVTRLLMEAVAALPAGALVLPGVDSDQPDEVWSRLNAALTGEDHPQFRYAALLQALGQSPADIRPWLPDAAPDPARNALISLALRPAPVTDSWKRDGPSHDPLFATRHISLIEAPSPRQEATALALRLRAAVDDGRRVALVTPDRILTRRVTAALRRWGIRPDDSAGEPLHQSAPGRFLRQTAKLLTGPASLSTLLALLKHPITASAPDARGPHRLWLSRVEPSLRESRVTHPTRSDIAGTLMKADNAKTWLDWLTETVLADAPADSQPLTTWLDLHLRLTEQIAAGAGARAQTNTSELWETDAGTKARAAMEALRAAASHAEPMSATDYARLIDAHLQSDSVQTTVVAHPNVMIWGTLEARVMGADLVILAGLNEGIWPANPGADPWMNRALRNAAGLLLPDRQIGLAAHDFQQAIAAPEAVLSRALRDDETETVPSRWLNRLTNLLDGLGQSGTQALSEMRDRGSQWIGLANAIDQPRDEHRAERAPRPAPCPPVLTRPRGLAVTSITKLVRDPYAIYARYILRLRALPPLRPEADALIRGIAYHDAMERFLVTRSVWQSDPTEAHKYLSESVHAALTEIGVDPFVSVAWQSRLMRVADRIVQGELNRLSAGVPVLQERKGRILLDGIDFTLSATPDRIDQLQDGTFAIYDYKSGTPPTPKQVKAFDKQLTLEAAMLERNAFTGLAGRVSALGYIALGSSGKELNAIDIEDDGAHQPDLAWQQLHALITAYDQPDQGYTARRAAESTNFDGEYDHLARYGEWSLTDPPLTLRVGHAR